MPGIRKTTSNNSYETYKKNNQRQKSNHGRSSRTAKAKATTAKATASVGLKGKVVLPKAGTSGTKKPSAAEIARTLKKAAILEKSRSGLSQRIGGKASGTVSAPFSFSSRGGIKQQHNAAQNAASYSLPTVDDYRKFSSRGGLKQQHNAAQNESPIDSTAVTVGPRAPGAFATTANSIDRRKEQQKEIAKEAAVTITRYDDPTVDFGPLLQDSRQKSHAEAMEEQHPGYTSKYTKMEEDVDFILSNEDFLANPEAAAEYVAYVAGLNDETRGFILNNYYAADGDEKLGILNAILSAEGWTRQTEHLYDSLSPEEQEQLDRMRISSFSETGDYEEGKKIVDDYYEDLKLQKETEFEANWAKENYGNADDFLSRIYNNAVGLGPKINTGFGMLVADIVTPDRELTSPLDGVDLWNGEYQVDGETHHYAGPSVFTLENASAIVKNFVNFFLWAGEKGYQGAQQGFTKDINRILELTGKEPLAEDTWQEINDAVVEWGTHVAEDYWKEVYMTEVRADAAEIDPNVRKAGDVIGTVASIVPIVALSVANPTIGLATLGVSSGGLYARQAYDSGASLTDAVTYGTMMGLAEMGTEKIFTGFGYFGKGAINKLADKTGVQLLSKDTLNALHKFKISPYGQALSFFTHSGAEATEEMAMEVMQSYMQRATYDPDAQNATLEEIAAAGGMGAIVSGILGIPVTINNASAATFAASMNNSIDTQINNTASAQIKEIEARMRTGELTEAQAKYAIEEITRNPQLSVEQSRGKDSSLPLDDITKQINDVSIVRDVSQTLPAEASVKIDGYVNDGTITREQGNALSQVVDREADNGSVMLPTSTNGLAQINKSVYNTNIEPNVDAGAQETLQDINALPYLTKTGGTDNGLTVSMAAAQGKDQAFGTSTLTGNAAESKVAATSDEAMDSLKEQAKGKTVGDTVSAAFMENGQVKVYTASVNESGISPVLARNATAEEKAVLQGNDGGTRNRLDVERIEGNRSKSEVLAQNRAQGRAYEQEKFTEFSKNYMHAQEQITIKTPNSIKTRLDAIGLDAEGNVVINEFKSSETAPLTPNQKIAFPEIFDSGGTVAGRGKGIFSGGYTIPAGTDIKIIRPPK